MKKLKISKFSMGKTRVSILSDISIKVEYSPDGIFEENELIITEYNCISAKQKYSVKKINKGFKLKTKILQIIVEDAFSPFSEQNLKIIYHSYNAERIWHYRMKDEFNLGGSAMHLFKYPEGVSEKEMYNGVLSRNGFFAYYDRSNAFYDKDWVSIKDKKGYEIIYFIGYGKNINQALIEYGRIFGRPAIPPKWAFGFWYSRWHKYNQNELLDIPQRYRAAGIPIDVVVIDTDWRKKGWIGYEWNQEYIPEPDKLIKEMMAQGIKLTLNDHPGYGFSEPITTDDPAFILIKEYLKDKYTKEELANRFSNEGWKCNWLDKRDVYAFMKFCIEPKLKDGLTFWWIDGWGGEGIFKNEEYYIDHETRDPMRMGPDGREKLHPQFWLNKIYYEKTKEVIKKRSIILSRWGGIGSHRYPIWFSGDTYSNWETLRFQVRFTYTAGNVLTFYWSHDIGGFLGENISKELFVRWVEFGSLSPIMRTHSSSALREPWIFDQETVEIFRRFVRLRYSLIPYFYSLAIEGYFNCKPIIRGMYHNYPNIEESYIYREQYMIGNFILIAPITEPAWKTHQKCNSKKINIEKAIKRIFLPRGEWFNLYHNQILGQGSYEIIASLNEIPFFIINGAIISADKLYLYKNNFGLYAQKSATNTLYFDIFIVKKNEIKSFYKFYEDDGNTEIYKKNIYSIIPISLKYKNKKIILLVNKAINNYPYKNIKRILFFTIHFSKDTKIISCNYVFEKGNLIFNEISSSYSTWRIKTEYYGKKIKIIIKID